MSKADSTPAPRAAVDREAAGRGVWCIVVAGGSGTRFGGLKQFEYLRDIRVIDRAVATAAQSCEGIVVVLPGEHLGAEIAHFQAAAFGRVEVVAGAATRAGSVRAGLAAVPESARYVLVHDGARPLATSELFGRVIDALREGAEAVVPAVTVADTLRSVGGGSVDRDSVRAVQTPQGFSAAVLREAHSTDGEATDDAGLVEQIGYTVKLVEGERLNLKLTEQLDLILAASMIDSGALGVIQ
ncbi:MAG: IspD/TarI family cytidylyltransferase [Microthrixaceae bacterium]